MKKSIKQKTGIFLSALTIAIGCAPPVRTLSALPVRIHLTAGHSTSFAVPKSVQVSISDEGTCHLTDEASEYILTGEAAGDASLVISVMGVPLKTVPVSVAQNRMVMPGGQSIGVALKTRGALVIGMSDVNGMESPARRAGLRTGDRIVSVDGKPIESAMALSDCLTGENQLMTVARDDAERIVPVTALADSRDGCYRLGAWVRDSTAGVGTLSFYDPESGGFAALGHPITDADTGAIMPIGEGYIYESRIVGLEKGQSGAPGELKGEFFQDEKRIGEAGENHELGLYGAADAPLINPLFPNGISVMARSEVQLGAAQIITTIEGKGMQMYDCEIAKRYPQDRPDARSLVIRITDPALLQTTGGIVQGMSGSPVIQDGRLAGAVTHVFVNDPTQGYGLYAEWMLALCDEAA